MKVKDAPALRAEMRDYLGSKGQYYRYKLGQLKLLPEQQAYIKQLFARYGYKDVEFDHFRKRLISLKANFFSALQMFQPCHLSGPTENT